MRYVQPFMASPDDLPVPGEGWAEEIMSITATQHYYRGDTALCRYASRAPKFMPAGENGSPRRCRGCLAALDKEKVE